MFVAVATFVASISVQVPLQSFQNFKLVLTFDCGFVAVMFTVVAAVVVAVVVIDVDAAAILAVLF